MYRWRLAEKIDGDPPPKERKRRSEEATTELSGNILQLLKRLLLEVRRTYVAAVCQRACRSSPCPVVNPSPLPPISIHDRRIIPRAPPPHDPSQNFVKAFVYIISRFVVESPTAYTSLYGALNATWIDTRADNQKLGTYTHARRCVFKTVVRACHHITTPLLQYPTLSLSLSHTHTHTHTKTYYTIVCRHLMPLLLLLVVYYR